MHVAAAVTQRHQHLLPGHLPDLVPAASTTTTERGGRFPVARASSSTSYPFHPDRLDPAKTPNAVGGDSSVDWYYSNYNNDEPFVGPGAENVLLPSGGPRLAPALAPFLLITFVQRLLLHF